MSDRLTRIGEMAHGTVRHDDVCWMFDEIERLRNLKGTLMELGNRLVLEHGWEPAAGAWGVRHVELPAGHQTGLIAGLTQQINDSHEMREALSALGYEWRMMETD